MTRKPLNNCNTDDVKKNTPDIVIYGNPDAWKLLCKVSSRSQGWMKSTKIMDTSFNGVVLQVTTEHYDKDGNVTACAEALCYLPGASAEFYLEKYGEGKKS